METLSVFLNQVCLWMFAGLLVYAAWSDFREFLIPNRISIGLILLYPAFVLSSGQVIDWQMACLIAGGILLVGMLLFSRNWMGGGDVKLLTAGALWAGPDLAFEFVALTAVAGGALSLAFLLRLNYGWIVGFPASASASRNVPYGVAIAAGGLFVATRLMMSVGSV